MDDTSPSLREIRIFVAVYEECSFTAAAVREHATQSGVSHHIRKIEERLKTTLFSRGQGVVPTPAGTAYYQRCLEVIRAHEKAIGALSGYTRGLTGQFTAGLTPALTACQLAPAYVRFSNEHPNALARLIDSNSASLVQRVLDDSIDFAIVAAPLPTKANLVAERFCLAPQYLVSGRQVEGQDRPVRLADVTDLKLVITETQGEPSEVHRYLERLNVHVPQLEFDGFLGVLGFIQASDWKTILPGLMVIHELTSSQRQFTVCELRDPSLTLELMLVRLPGRKLSDAALAFVEHLRAVTLEHSALLPNLGNENCSLATVRGR